MSDLFNPQSARYRRGSYIVSMYCGAFVTMGLILSDFGAQEHILSPVSENYVFQSGISIIYSLFVLGTKVYKRQN